MQQDYFESFLYMELAKVQREEERERAYKEKGVFIKKYHSLVHNFTALSMGIYPRILIYV